MSYSRYNDRDKIKNASEIYEEIFDKRDVNFINQYTTPKLTFPSPEDEASLATVRHIWKQGDRFYKLSHQYYGDANLWWVIAQFNRTPTEAHLETGDVIEIPTSLADVMRLLEV